MTDDVVEAMTRGMAPEERTLLLAVADALASPWSPLGLDARKPVIKALAAVRAAAVEVE